jgi:hypothetical protein
MRQYPLLSSNQPLPLMIIGLPELTAERWERLRPL